jgi:ORF6N domain.
MLDRDLAEMYGVETRRLNEQIKRNIKRFPDDFMFQLKKEEFANLMSQFATSSWGGTRKLPYAFTELGVAMLSSVLNSDTAIEINMAIMRAFVAVRRLLTNPPVERIAEFQQEFKEFKMYMDEVLTDQNDINEDTRMQLELINQTLAELQADKRLTDKPYRRIGFHRDENI